MTNAMSNVTFPRSGIRPERVSGYSELAKGLCALYIIAFNSPRVQTLRFCHRHRSGLQTVVK